MEAKQNLSHIKRKKGKDLDLCPVCDYNLYLDTKFTQRIGVLNEQKDIVSWICPKCSSEFDLKNNILYIYGENSAQGEA